MDTNIKRTKPCSKSTITADGVEKVAFKGEEALDYFRPATVVNTPKGLQYCPDVPVANTVTSADGTQQILLTTMYRLENANTVPVDELRTAMSNTLQITEIEERRLSQLTLQSHLKNTSQSYPIATITGPNVPAQAPIPTRPDEFHIEDTGTLIYNEDSQTYELLCNFKIVPICLEYHYRNEKLTDTVIVMEIYMEERLKKQLSISSSELDNIAKKVGSAIPSAYLSYKVLKPERKLAFYLRNHLNNVPSIKVLKSSGWIEDNGRHLFVHDDHDSVEGLRFSTGNRIASQPLSSADIVDSFKLLLNLAEPKIISPMIGTCLLGILYKLFSAANEELAPRFVLALIGKSGVLKTAASKVLFLVYNTDSDSSIPASFQDTTTSLEMRFDELPCVPILVDDYYNLGNAGKKTDMQNMLERAIRFVGDGIGRNRSNANLENIKGVRPTGTLVITGEATTGQHSMLLRCLTLPIDSQTFSGEILRVFQNDKTLWTTILYHFVAYLEKNYDDIVKYIFINFSKLCEEYKDNFQDARPVYQFTQLYLAFDIFNKYLCHLTGQNTCGHLIAQCQEGCLLAVKESQDFARRNASEAKYILTFYELVINHQIYIAPNKEQYASGINSYDGYEESGFYLINSSSVYIKIRKYLVQKGNDTLDENAATQTFYKAGLLEVEHAKNQDGKPKIIYKKKVTINGQRTRLLKIDIQLLNDFIKVNL